MIFTGYPLVGRDRLGSGKLPKLRKRLKKRAESEPSGAAGGGPQLSITPLCRKGKLPIVATFLRVFASSTGYPIEAHNIMLPKHQTQLRSVFLNMPHTVQLKLQETGFHPLKYAALLRFLVC